MKVSLENNNFLLNFCFDSTFSFSTYNWQQVYITLTS